MGLILESPPQEQGAEEKKGECASSIRQLNAAGGFHGYIGVKSCLLRGSPTRSASETSSPAPMTMRERVKVEGEGRK